jgi:hypothetical protein
MSAFVVGHDHIDGLLTFVTGHNGGYGQRQTVSYWDLNDERCQITQDNATEIGRILLRENERSVMARYPEGNMPGTIGEASEDYVFRPWTMSNLDAVMILKACACFDYQACETGDYDKTLAWRIIHAIRMHAIHRLPRYSDSPGWELHRPAVRKSA